MAIFNSLGSNYNFNFVVKSLFAITKNSKAPLVNLLKKKYNGEVILVYKGREALALALELCKLPKDASVAINGFTCVAVYNAVEEAGFAVELLENEEEDLNFSAKILEKKLKSGSNIKAVIIQNTLGYPCEAEEIAKICKTNNLILIEDLAHSVGCRYAIGQEAGTIGDFACLSFSQDKMIDAVSGGALIIRNKKYKISSLSLGKLSVYRQMIDRIYPVLTFKIRTMYGIGIGKILHFLAKILRLISKPSVDGFYKKYALPDWYCYLAVLGFRNLDDNILHRRNIARIYKNTINSKLFYKIIAENVELSANLRFPIFTDKRESLIKYLKNHKIYVSDIWYSSVSSDLINANDAASKILNLPTHRNVSEKDAKYISERINLWLKSK